MTKIVFLIKEDPDGGYEAHALGPSIITQADTLDQLRDMIRDAMRCHFPDPQIRAQPSDYIRSFT